jgi:hypothetical protein
MEVPGFVSVGALWGNGEGLKYQTTCCMPFTFSNSLADKRIPSIMLKSRGRLRQHDLRDDIKVS